MLKKNLILLIMFCMCSYTRIYAQDNYVIKIIEREEIDYYYVYRAVSSKDTLVFLSQKYNSQDFKKIRLKVDKSYKISATPIYKVKISNDQYLLASFGGIIIDKVSISNKGDLPILITDYNCIRNKNHIKN